MIGCVLFYTFLVIYMKLVIHDSIEVFLQDTLYEAQPGVLPPFKILKKTYCLISCKKAGSHGYSSHSTIALV